GLRLIGPPLGGVLFALARALPFVLDAISYVAAFAGVAAIKRPLGPDATEAAAREPVRSAVADGLRFVASTPYTRFVAWWAAVMNMLGSGLTLLVLLLVYAQGGGPAVIGLTQGLAAVGGIAGAAVSTRVIRRF